jgi:hypothetical protein
LDILKDHHLVIMRDHGFLILGSSLQDAGARTQTILQEVLGVPA